MIKSFRLSGYRAYRDEIEFDFAKPGDGKFGLTIIVGRNNSGKSTAINLIRTIFAEELDVVFDRESRHEDILPFARVSYLLDGLEFSIACRPEGIGSYSKKILSYLKEPDKLEAKFQAVRRKVKFVPARRSWSDRFNRNARQNLLMLEDALYRHERNQDAPLGNLLAHILFDGQKAKFDQFLKRIVPEIVDWTVDSYGSQDCISYVTTSGRLHSASTLGDGFGSVFRLVYTLFRALPGETVILDEPELSLHPEAQKRLYLLLRDLSQLRQIIVATHSPHMVNWSDLERGVRIYKLKLDENGWVASGRLSEKSFRAIRGAVRSDFKNRRMFDALAKELFFSDKVVFCEGLEDVALLEDFLEKEGLPQIPFFGYGAGGAPMIKPWMTVAYELGIRAAAIFDADQKELARICEREFSGSSTVKVFVLPADDIRDKYLRDGRCATTGTCREVRSGPIYKAGLFDSSGEVKRERRDELSKFLTSVSDFIAA